MSSLVRGLVSSLAFSVPLVFGAVPMFAQAAAPEATPAAEEPRDESGIEVIMVTARKREESVQDIPIAVTAFSAEGLEASNIEDVADIQFNVPNLSYSKDNFNGAGNMSLRGVGNLATANSSENGTGIHINSAPFSGSRIFEAEFYDVERVEVLRGPQGTLFGRSAPAGALNIFTKKPVLEETGGYLQGDYGKFNHGEVRGALNVPLGEHFAARVAGYYFRRDGTTLNTYRNDHIDDRNVYALRASLAGDWDAVDFNLMAQWFNERDHRMRVNKQGCTRDNNQWPASIGCRGDSLGQERSNNQASVWYEFGLLGDTAIGAGFPLPLTRYLTGPLGVLNGSPTSLADRLLQDPLNGLGTPTAPFDNTVNPRSLRQVSTQLTPQYHADEVQTTLEVNFHLSEDVTLTSITGYHRATTDSKTDYFWSVPSEPLGGGPRFFEFPDSGDGVGRSLAGTYDREFTFDRTTGFDDLFTQELHLSTDFDGPINATVGAIYNEGEVSSQYYVYAAAFEWFWSLPGDPIGLCSVDAAGDKVGPFFAPTSGTGPAVAGPRVQGNSCFDLLPESSYYNNDTNPTKAQSYAVFGELYWDVFERTRLTLGARYTDDHKTESSRVNFLVCEVASFSATTGDLDCELEPFTGKSGGWTQVTWKVSLDQHFDLPFAPDSLAYATVSTGYKGGGFNPPVSCAQSGGGCSSIGPTFDQEQITAYELGYKGVLFDRLLLNLSGFFYDYKGMQVSKIVARTAVNENIDTEIWGIELETTYAATDALTLDLNVAYLNTAIQNAESIDAANPTAGRPGWIPVKSDGLDGSNAVCNPSIQALIFAPICVEFDDSTDADGYQVDGFPTRLNGKELPGAPNWSVKFGAQYAFPIFSGWEATPRVDFYWRSKSWGRIYNSGKDPIDSWDQLDAQVRFTKEGSPFAIELWAKNLQNNDDVTGHYVTDATSENFTNLFILEPRTYGFSVRYTFGESEI